MKYTAKAIYWCKCGNHHYPPKNWEKKIVKPELHSQGTQDDWEVEITSYCCDEMKEAVNDRFIGNSEPDGGYRGDVYSIFHCSPYPEGAAWDSMNIQFCPFCGKGITKT